MCTLSPARPRPFPVGWPPRLPLPPSCHPGRGRALACPGRSIPGSPWPQPGLVSEQSSGRGRRDRGVPWNPPSPALTCGDEEDARAEDDIVPAAVKLAGGHAEPPEEQQRDAEDGEDAGGPHRPCGEKERPSRAPRPARGPRGEPGGQSTRLRGVRPRRLLGPAPGPLRWHPKRLNHLAWVGACEEVCQAGQHALGVTASIQWDPATHRLSTPPPPGPVLGCPLLHPNRGQPRPPSALGGAGRGPRETRGWVPAPGAFECVRSPRRCPRARGRGGGYDIK